MITAADVDKFSAALADMKSALDRGKSMPRSHFAKMSPHEQMAHIRNGGTVADDPGDPDAR